VLFARAASDRFIRRQQPAVGDATTLAGFDECGALLDTERPVVVDALSAGPAAAAHCRPGQPAGPGQWSVRIGGGVVRASGTHLWTSPLDTRVKRPYQFAWYEPDGAHSARPLFLTTKDQTRIESRSREVPSRDGVTEISAANLWTDGERVEGVSVTAGGVVYAWSVKRTALEVPEGLENREILRLDLAERVVGGRATAVWRDGSSDPAGAQLRVLSNLGEVVEIGRRRQDSLISAGLRDRIGAADVLDLGDSVVLASQRGWCRTPRCGDRSEFRDFVMNRAIAPKVLLRIGSASTASHSFVAITGNGTAYLINGTDTSARVQLVVDYRTGDADLMVRLAGSTSALVVRNAAPAGERLSLIVAGDDGVPRAVHGDRGESALFAIAPKLALLSGTLSSDGYFSFLGDTPEGRLGLACRSSGTGLQFVLGPCVAIPGRRGWEPSAVAATGGGEDGFALTALGYSNGAVTVGLKNMADSNGKAAAADDAEFRAHVGRLSSLHLSAGPTNVWHLVSAGIDGVVLQTDVERSAGNTVSARFPPTVLDRNEFPVNFVRSGGERIYAAADDMHTTVLDFDNARLIRRACTIFAGRYPAMVDYLPRTWLADLGRLLGTLDVAQICRAAMNASAGDPAFASTQTPQAAGDQPER
jgi:hypothetical protein